MYRVKRTYDLNSVQISANYKSNYHYAPEVMMASYSTDFNIISTLIPGLIPGQTWFVFLIQYFKVLFHKTSGNALNLNLSNV